MLNLSSGIRLPTHLATQTTLLVGKRGSGKSSTATRLAEQLHKSHIPFAVLDPVDVWWGMKAGQDGKPEGGLDVYIFGGDHADLPLEATAGTLMADVLVEHRISAVFVLRQFTEGEKSRFVAAFAEQLFRRNKAVLHLFCEEAHEVMPQHVLKGEGQERMLHWMSKLQKLGRTSGIGLTAPGERLADMGDVPETSEELQEMLYRRLPSACVRILRLLVVNYPNPLHKDEVALQTGQRPTSGGYFNNLGRLRSLGLIDYPKPGFAVAQPVLFLERA